LLIRADGHFDMNNMICIYMQLFDGLPGRPW
jgi:hypothetical protein